MDEHPCEYAIWDRKYNRRYHDWEPPYERCTDELLQRLLDLNEDYGPGSFEVVRRPVLPWESLDGDKREEF